MHKQLGADAVATGHYCRRDTDAQGRHRLLAGLDGNKDQSYFLCQVHPEQLADALFPVGDLESPKSGASPRRLGCPPPTRKTGACASSAR